MLGGYGGSLRPRPSCPSGNRWAAGRGHCDLPQHPDLTLMKNTSITLEYRSGSIPVTLEQLHALGVTDTEIEAGAKRFETVSFGPWHQCHSIRGIVQNGDTWHTPRTAGKISHLGMWSEGVISLNGKKRTVFTNSQLFELPDGRLVNVAVLYCHDRPVPPVPAVMTNCGAH